jgi:hypothetical protein
MPDTSAEQFREIEELVSKINEIGDARVREDVHALIAAILDLHGSGLDRMLDIVHDSGDAGRAAIRRFAADNLIASLLVLHNLHPDDIGVRVQRALSKMSGNAELLGVFEGEVRVRLTGAHGGLKESVESALREAIPDASGIIVEEAPSAGFVPLEAICLHPVNTQ